MSEGVGGLLFFVASVLPVGWGISKVLTFVEGARTEASESYPCAFYSDHDILCICGQPNLKEDMIGCDGQNCKFKWYHFSCAEITRENLPEGEWLCGACSRV